MGFNVGIGESKFVAVSNVTLRFAFSEKVLFADLRTSRKTGNSKVNKETGEVIVDSDGNPVPERVYTRWEGRFVGNAFEAAKGLKNGQPINILNGWIDKEENIGNNGQKYVNVFVVIADFELSDGLHGDDTVDVDSVGENIERIQSAFRALNAGEELPFGDGEGRR